MIISAVTILNHNQLPFIDALLNLFSDDVRITSYLSTMTVKGYLIPLFLHILNIFSVFLSFKIINNSSEELLVQTRNNIVLNLIANSIAFNQLKQNVLKEMIFSMFIFSVILAGYYFDLINSDPTGSIIKELFNNNYFINY